MGSGVNIQEWAYTPVSPSNVQLIIRTYAAHICSLHSIAILLHSMHLYTHLCRASWCYGWPRCCPGSWIPAVLWCWCWSWRRKARGRSASPSSEAQTERCLEEDQSPRRPARSSPLQREPTNDSGLHCGSEFLGEDSDKSLALVLKGCS